MSDAEVDESDVVVVGAGLSGLTAARDLQAAGRRVVVVDKGRSVGGRLATRRIGSARLDHGAQFFTQRGPELREFVDELTATGLVREWCRGFGSGDHHPRYQVVGGMNALAKHLAAGLEDVRTGLQVTAVRRTDRGWSVIGDDVDLRAPAVLLTSPVPQTLALLEAGAVELDAGIGPALARIDYDPAFALMLLLDGPGAVPEPGAVQFDAAHPDPARGPFSFVADNAAKGMADPSALTLHASPRWSRTNWGRPDDEVVGALVDAASAWTGGAGVVEVQLKRWLYAAPRTTWPERSCVAVDGPEPLVLAGDAFDGPRVEGAYVSGRSGATAVLRARTVDRA